MARIRTFKPEAFQSETLAEVSLAAERTFFGLTTQVDDRGRIADKPASINGALWAERSERDEHTAADLDLELKELEAVGAVCRYVGCDGKRYVHFVTWDDHQKIDKPSRPRTPRCPEHQPAPDECGKHGKEPCPAPGPRERSGSPRESSTNTREDSRALDSHENGTNRAGGGETAHTGSADSTDKTLAPVVQLRPPLELQEQTIPASPREDSRDLPEGPMTYDRGSRTEDLSAPPADTFVSGEQGALIVVREEPKRKPRKKPAPSPEHPVAEDLANGYWDRYRHTTSQSWIAVRQVILQTLKNGADRNELAFALDLIGREENPVTANILTIARRRVRAERSRNPGTEVVPAGQRATGDRRQQATDERYQRAMQRAMAKEQAS
jgi:hypothetical protein